MSLDDKLSDIVDGVAFWASDFSDDGEIEPGDAITQIKQAFMDEGWIPGRMTPKGYLATGQEWYDRFFEVFADDELVFTAPDLEIIYKAAKKASGL